MALSRSNAPHEMWLVPLSIRSELHRLHSIAMAPQHSTAASPALPSVRMPEATLQGSLLCEEIVVARISQKMSDRQHLDAANALPSQRSRIQQLVHAPWTTCGGFQTILELCMQ